MEVNAGTSSKELGSAESCKTEVQIDYIQLGHYFQTQTNQSQLNYIFSDR